MGLNLENIESKNAGDYFGSYLGSYLFDKDSAKKDDLVFNEAFPYHLFPKNVSNNLKIIDEVKPLLEDDSLFTKVDFNTFKKHVMSLFQMAESDLDGVSVDVYIYDRLTEDGDVFCPVNEINQYASYNDKLFIVVTPWIIGLASMVYLYFNKGVRDFSPITFIDADNKLEFAEIINDYDPLDD